MKQIHYIIFILLSLVSAKDAVVVKVNQPGQIVIELSIDSINISSNSGLIITNPSLAMYFNPGFPIVPYYQEELIGVPSNANVKIFSSDQELIGEYNPIILGPENAKGIEYELSITNKYNGNFPLQNVQLSPIQDVAGIISSKIEIFPFSIRDDQLFVTKNISVQILWNTNLGNVSAKLLSKTSLKELKSKGQIRKLVEHNIPEYQFSKNIAEIIVDTTAWYKIINSELVASGIDLNNTDITTIRLWNKENEIPIYIESSDDKFNDNDIIIFYGYKNPPPDGTDYDNNFYTNDNTYWLTWGNGTGERLSEQNVSPNQFGESIYVPGIYKYSQKIEHDDEYVRLSQVNQYLLQNWDVIDHFFMTPEIIVGTPFEFEFILNDPDSISNKGFEIEVLTRGMTTSEHDLDVLINNQFISDVKWLGRNQMHIYKSDIDCSYLKNGKNILTLILSQDDPSANDLIYLNWFKVKYPKYFTAEDDYIQFSTDSIPNQKTVQFKISGFTNSNILLFKDRKSILGDYQITANEQTDDYTIKFQDSDAQISSIYEAVSYEKLGNVKKITLMNAIVDLLSNIRSSYIVIAPDSFETILEPLIEYHNGTFVNIEDIYRQYSHGVLSPYAIKSFLQNIYEQSNGELQYALLAMISNLNDWRTGKIDRPESIPAMSVFTYNMGTVACDYWYSVFDDEFWLPSISVSRFPVFDKTELKTIVDKTMYYHERNFGLWDNKALLIGGADDIFRFQSEALVDIIKNNGTFLSRLYASPSTPDSSFYGTSDTLKMHLNRGLSYINFFGHGGGAVWADNRLLHRNDIDKNVNNYNKIPFITSMTCFTGDFSYSYGLGRLMLIHKNGGTIAWYGASGLGWSNNDYYLVKPLQELLFSDEDLTIGELINLSKTQYFLSYSNIYPEIAATQLYQYNLIGDPAIKVKKPFKGNVTISPKDPESGEDITISSAETTVDSIYYQLFFPDNYSQNQATYFGNSLPDQLSLPNSLDKGIYNLNISYKSGIDLYKSVQQLSVAGSFVNIKNTIPNIPTICDSINIVAEVSDRNGISSVRLLINGNFWSEMVNLDSNIYVLKKLIPPQPLKTVLNLTCQVINTIQDTTNSIPKFITIGEIPNISPTKAEFKIDDKINLVIEIESTTTSPVDANVELFIFKEDQWQLIGRDTVNFNGIELLEAQFPDYYPIGINSYKVVTNANLTCMSNDLISDDTLTFNLETKAFWVTPELGSTDDGVTHSVIGIKNLEIEIPTGSLTEQRIIQLLPLNEILIASQPNFEVVQFQQSYKGIEIIWVETNDLKINWIIGNTAILSSPQLYKYYDEYRTWLPITYNVISDSTIRITSNGGAKFAFLENDDVERPIISASINGQNFLNDNYLTTNPSIQFSIYDQNGIDHRRESIQYWTNTNLTDLYSEISGVANNINILINPTLSIFDSTMSVLIHDAAGNESDTLKLSFIVSEHLDLIDYGTYPNPFTKSAMFAYELTESVEKLTITIYSVEGRKIRSLDQNDINSGLDLNAAGYHEIIWDGRNQDGSSVGNGNYFYQINAKNNKTVLKRTGKILRMQ